jgi:hypothetical protein
VNDAIEEQVIKAFGDELTREDYQLTLREVEESLKSFTKANITELRATAKPHLLVRITQVLKL